MIFSRLIMALAAAAAFATSAAVCVAALAFALYALVEPQVGRAGAAGTVAGATALLIALVGLAVILKARRKREAAALTRGGNMVERLLALVRDKPVMAVYAALGAGFMAIRNPKYLGAAIRAFLDGRAPRRR